MKDIYTILLDNPNFTNLVNQLKKREELFNLIQDHLPSEIREGCSFGTYENHILTLALKSSALATHLRFRVKTLKEQLKQYRVFEHLREIRYIILPVTDRIKKLPSIKPQEELAFSEELCARFADMATNTEDLALKTVLERFSQKKIKKLENKKEK